MGAHTKSRPLLYRDHLLRTSSLLDLAHGELQSVISMMNAIALNYPTLCTKWLSWALQLVLVSHQMEALSQSLYTMGIHDTKGTSEKPMTFRSASIRYFAELGGKNDHA